MKANQGSSGVDGITIEDIETNGVNRYLTGIQLELKGGTYRPLPVRRVMIPKPDGSQRPLGIPCVKDRIVQMATKIAIEPVFEADFKDCSYGFRPKRSAKQALEVVRKACNNTCLPLYLSIQLIDDSNVNSPVSLVAGDLVWILISFSGAP